MIHLGRWASSGRRRGFRLRTYVVSTGSPGQPYIGGKLSCTASRLETCLEERATWCSGRAAFEEKENNRVTRVNESDTFRQTTTGVTFGDKLSHIVGLGFPLIWLTPKRREQLSCRESHAVSVESYQSRVRARVDSPYKTKRRDYWNVTHYLWFRTIL